MHVIRGVVDEASCVVEVVGLILGRCVAVIFAQKMSFYVFWKLKYFFAIFKTHFMFSRNY
jgi:hypothetical protein